MQFLLVRANKVLHQYFLVVLIIIYYNWTTSKLAQGYQSPVHTIKANIDVYRCPNNAPLQFTSFNFTSTGLIKTIQFQCLDHSNPSAVYTGCSEPNSVPSLTLHYYSNPEITTSCKHSCFTSGIILVNNTISRFICSTTVAISQHLLHRLINCSWSEQYTLLTIGSDSLANNGVITDIRTFVSIGYHRIFYWRYRYCLLTEVNDLMLCSNDELINNVSNGHTHATKSNGFNTWHLSCTQGYTLMGPAEVDCTDDSNRLYVLEKDTCINCCQPLSITGVLATCTGSNQTQFHCNKGKYLSGSYATNDVYCSALLDEHDKASIHCTACDSAIQYCTDCYITSNRVLLCRECVHPNGHPMLLTKNKKKCKIKATVKSFEFKRTIHTWNLSCIAVGSPKLSTSLHVDGIVRASKIALSMVHIEPIKPYKIKQALCAAENKWGNHSTSLTLVIKPMLMDLFELMYVTMFNSFVVMNCVLSGDFDSWNWFFEGQMIDPGSIAHSQYLKLPNTSLKIMNITASNEGRYKCVAENPIITNIVYKILHYTVPSDSNNDTDDEYDLLFSSVTIVMETTDTPTVPPTPPHDSHAPLSPSSVLLLHLVCILFLITVFGIVLFLLWRIKLK